MVVVGVEVCGVRGSMRWSGEEKGCFLLGVRLEDCLDFFNFGVSAIVIQFHGGYDGGDGGGGGVCFYGEE